MQRRGYCPAEFLKECFEIKKEAEANVIKSDLLGVKDELDV